MKGRGTKSHMTPLDRGLALTARKDGFTIAALCIIFHRDTRTMNRLFLKNNLTKRYRRCPPTSNSTAANNSRT